MPNMATFTVRLQTQPAANTVVTVSAVPSALDGIAISPTSLAFTPTNFNMSQTITITGLPDVDLRADPFSVRVTSATLGVPDQTVYVSEIDDDTQAMVLSKVTSPGVCPSVGLDFSGAFPAVSEGGTFQFCVNLRFQPLASTIVDAALSPSIVSRTSPALSFSTVGGTAGGYDRPQLVALAISTDPDAASETGQVALSSSGIPPRTVTFTINDPDQQFLSFTGLTGGSATSGDAGTISVLSGLTNNAVKVRLGADPISTAVVMCAAAGPPVTVMGSATYTFTGGATGTWATFQTIPLRVDSTLTGDVVVVTCVASGGTPPLASRSFTVNVP